MTRADIIQRVIDATHAVTYLEIGVFEGATFLSVRAGRKIAVDPRPRIRRNDRLRALVRDWRNWRNKYYALESDPFFVAHGERLARRGLDVVFVDGLHTYAQSLRDIENALRCLRPRGVVVVDDCNPPTEAAAHPAASYEDAQRLGLAGWTGEWCGDVWKSIVHLRGARRDLRVFVLDCLWGMGIVTRGTPDDAPPTVRVDSLSYTDLVEHRAALLNLKPVSHLEALLHGRAAA